MGTSSIIAVALLVLVVVGGSLQFLYRRAAAQRQFDGLRLTSEDPRLCIDGTTAAVVFEQRQYVDAADAANRYSLFRICKNSYGEYFLFMSGSKPYVTHLTKDRAMNAMRSDRKAFAKEFPNAA
jgi:hypothetical protein